MISTGTIASLALLVIAVAAAGAAGLFDADHLAGLTMQACLLIGLFASATAALVGQLWRVQEAGRDKRHELPAPVRTAIVVVICVCIGLAAFDNRRTELLTSLPDRASLSVSRYCSDKPPLVEEEAVQTQVRKVRGCSLILRAYRLGYAKKLGPCAPKKVKAKTNTKIGAPLEICRDRQPDEPLLHYGWRVLAEKANRAIALDPVGTIGTNLSEFKMRLGYVSTLIASQRQAITASPHAAHHLWVNLPAPHSESFVARYLVPRKDCSNRYRDMKTKLRWGDGDKAASTALEHAFGALLFDPQLGAPVGYCREYTVHWNAPRDACARLADNPTRFLARSGALASVRAVLERHRAKSDMRQLARELGKKKPKQPLPDPRRLVSFQCLIVDAAGTNKLQRGEVSVDGSTLAWHEVRTPKLGVIGDEQLTSYKQVARVLGGVDYNGPVEQKSIGDLAKRPVAEAEVNGTSFALTQLDLLRQSDPFVAGSTALGRDELVDVFPFRFHLQNFVDAFRRAYRRQRGRL